MGTGSGFIRTKDCFVRRCIDYRKLNQLTRKDYFSLPLKCLDCLSGYFWFSILNTIPAYWQFQIKESDLPKTAYITKYGLFEFACMIVGLCNSPASYARVVNLVLRGLAWGVVLAFWTISWF